MNSNKVYKILSIDDDPSVRISISSFLSDFGYKVIEAENGAVGIEKFSADKPDLVLVDLRMPQIDGIGVLEFITLEAPEIPVIIISGAGAIGDAIQAIHKGAWDYLLKPISDMSHLLHTIEKSLERARLIRENRLHRENLETLVASRTKELEAANAALVKEINVRKESEKRYRLIAENTSDAIWTASLDLKYTYISPSVEKMLGYKAEELIGLDVSNFLSRESMDILLKSVANEITATAGKRTMDDPITAEVELKRKDRGRIWSEIHISSMRDKDNTLLGFLGVTRDISSRRRLEAKLRQAQKMESIGTLAGGIAHDFNNILGAIFGNLELALLHMPGDDPKRKRLDNIMTAGQRARDLVSQILAFSRQAEVEQRPVDIRLIVKEVLKLLRASLPTTIEISQNITSEKCRVLADPTQIHQVIINLCTNANHAMRENGGVLKVGLKVTRVYKNNLKACRDLRPGSWVELMISDTGCGIPGEIQDRIFDPYFTTKEKGVGTGLGLAVVHGIVESMGGVVEIFSEVGKGTKFRIYFPAIEEKSKKAGEPSDEALPRGTEKIILVDDEPGLAQIGGEMLEFLGYKVVTKTSAFEALAIFRQNPDDFDLVITDMTMPRMTGSTLAAEIMKVRPYFPVILCTGFSELITKDKSEAMGIKGFLMKPLNISDLARCIRSVLDNSVKDQGNAKRK